MDCVFGATIITLSGKRMIKSFAPVVADKPWCLILGSMPGTASLQANEYYAHKRNLFWPVMAEVLAIEITAPYPQRLTSLAACGIVLWDVLANCERAGSLDTAIVAGSEVVNDFATLLAQYPSIVRICFNGSKAAALFRKHVLPRLAVRGEPYDYRPLPSTSPANAGMIWEYKLVCWRKALQND